MTCRQSMKSVNEDNSKKCLCINVLPTFMLAQGQALQHEDGWSVSKGHRYFKKETGVQRTTLYYNVQHSHSEYRISTCLHFARNLLLKFMSHMCTFHHARVFIVILNRAPFS